MYAPSIHILDALRTAAEVGSVAPPRDPLAHAAVGRVTQPIDRTNDTGLIRADAAGDDPMIVSFRPSDLIGRNPSQGETVRFSIRSFTRTDVKGEPDALAALVRLAPDVVAPRLSKAPKEVAFVDALEYLGTLETIGAEGGEIVADGGRRFGFDFRVANRLTAKFEAGERVVFTLRGGMVSSIEKAPTSPGLLARLASLVGA